MENELIAAQKKKDEAYTQFATAGALHSSCGLPLKLGAYIGSFFQSRKEGMMLARTCSLAATLAKKKGK